MTVGDSQESLELGDVPVGGRRPRVTVTTGQRDDDASRWPPDANVQMGIMVEKETSQTIKMIR